MEHKAKVKIAIIILSVLLLLSISALSVTLILKRSANGDSKSVAVPENLITPSRDSSESIGFESEKESRTVNFKNYASSRTDSEEKRAATIKLYSKNPEENVAFKAENMLPGDSETKFFCVSVSYHNNVSVRFKTTVRPGFESLAEALKVKVTLLNSGDTLYDGLISGMPDNIAHSLLSQGSAVSDLYYEITAYLDTSVGNEYQNKSLVADFAWYVAEAENLDDSPKTGDTSAAVLWITISVVSALIFVLLFLILKRKENENNG